MHDRLLRRREVEKITGMSRSSIYRLMQDGDFPRPVKNRSRSRSVEGKRHHGLDRVAASGDGRNQPAQRSLDSKRRTIQPSR